MATKATTRNKRKRQTVGGLARFERGFNAGHVSQAALARLKRRLDDGDVQELLGACLSVSLTFAYHAGGKP